MLLNILIFSCLVSLPLPSTGRNQHVKKQTGHQPKKENADLDRYDHHHKQKDWKREDVNKLEFKHDIENHHKNENTKKFGDRHGEGDRHKLTDVHNKHQQHSARDHQKTSVLSQFKHQRNDHSQGKKSNHKNGHDKTDSFNEKVHHRTDQDHHSEHIHQKTKSKSNHHQSHHKSKDDNFESNIKDNVHHHKKMDFNNNKDQTSGSVHDQKKPDAREPSGKKRRSVGVWNNINNKFQSRPFEYPVTTDYPVSNEDYFDLNGKMGGTIIKKNDKRVKSVSNLKSHTGQNEGLFSMSVVWENFVKEIESNIDRVMKLQQLHHKGVKTISTRIKLDHGNKYNNKDYSYLGSIGSKNEFSEVTVKPIYIKGNKDLRNHGFSEFPTAFDQGSLSNYEERVEEKLKENANSERRKDVKYIHNHRGKPTSSHQGAGQDSTENSNKNCHHSSHYSGHRPITYYETGFPSLGHFRPNHHSHHSRPFDSTHSHSHHYSSTCKHKHDKPHASGAPTEKNKIIISSSHSNNKGIQSHDKVTSTRPSEKEVDPVSNISTPLPSLHQYAVHEIPDESVPSTSSETLLNNSHHVHINHEIHKHNGNTNASSDSITFPQDEITTKQKVFNNNENKLKEDLKTDGSDLCKNGGSVQVPLLNINLPCGDVSISGGHPDDFYKREFATSMTNVFHDYVEKQKKEEPVDIDPRIGRKRREVKNNIQRNIEKTEENNIDREDHRGTKNSSVFGEIVEVPKNLSRNDSLEYFELSMLSEYFLEAVDSLDESSLVQVLKALKDDYLSKSPGDENTVDQVYQKLVSSLLEYKRSNGDTDRRRRESPRKARAEAAAMLELLAATDGVQMESEQQDEPYSELENDYNQLDLGPESSENPSFLELVSLANKHKAKA